MGKQRSFRSKAANLVSDLTTVLLNPISDKPSNKPSPGHDSELEASQQESILDDGESSMASPDGPDTSSFTAFIYSLLKDDYFAAESEDGKRNTKAETVVAEAEAQPEVVVKPENVNVVRESGGKRGLLSRGKQSIGKAMSYAATYAGFRNQASEKKASSGASDDDKNECIKDGGVSSPVQSNDKELTLADLPGLSEPSLLLSQKTRLKLYASLPVLAKGRTWVLLYSTFRHGISLSTLYRRSMLCPGLSLLVVGDRRGAVFGGLVEAPLKPTKGKRYQGTNSTFLFTDVSGQAVIYRPTGANRYYTLCSPEFLALGGGHHFGLYLDGDLLTGSSAASETYGNSCLALSEYFEVKEIELWGFVYASRYEELLAESQNEAPGICRW